MEITETSTTSITNDEEIQEDFEELAIEAHDLLKILCDRPQPKYLAKSIKGLLEKLEAALAYYTVH